jgi:predicted nucleic acid-binding protein
VLDANILIRAVLGKRARQLIQQYAASIDFIAPESAFMEAEEHIPALCAKLGLDLDAVRAVYTGVSKLVQELPVAAYQEQEAQARARIERRDADDWPVIACALLLECPIWTEDNDFFGAGVGTWTSDRVELYLAEA